MSECRSFLQETRGKPESAIVRYRRARIAEAVAIARAVAEAEEARLAKLALRAEADRVASLERNPAGSTRPSAAIVRSIVAQEAEAAGITPQTLMGSGRDRRFVHARWRVFKRLRDYGYSLPAIGKAFGKDHTTVLHGLRGLELLAAKE